MLPINHMVAVSQTLSHDHPEAVREVCRLLRPSAALAQAEGTRAAPPDFSRDEMSRSLEMISRYAGEQGPIPRAYAADELFDDLTRTLR